MEGQARNDAEAPSREPSLPTQRKPSPRIQPASGDDLFWSVAPSRKRGCQGENCQGSKRKTQLPAVRCQLGCTHRVECLSRGATRRSLRGVDICRHLMGFWRPSLPTDSARIPVSCSTHTARTTHSIPIRRTEVVLPGLAPGRPIIDFGHWCSPDARVPSVIIVITYRDSAA